MKVISFFYRKGALSSEIRGQQIGKALGGRQNPTRDYQDNLCILVKVLPKTLARDRGLTFNLDHTYVDILDYTGGLPWLAGRPAVKVLAASRSSEQYLREHCPHTHVVFIPQHHCNFERQLRPTRPIKTVAYIGLMAAGPPPWYDEVNTAVHKMGLEMRYFTDFRTRHDVVNAYLQTDIQFTWYDDTMSEKWRRMKNALKVVNAASFGIPTVASFEPAYEAECKGWYRPAQTLPEAMALIEDLKLSMDPVNLPRLFWTNALPDIAEPYHIDHVAHLYRRLAGQLTKEPKHAVQENRPGQEQRQIP